jgi:hypothetical protein
MHLIHTETRQRRNRQKQNQNEYISKLCSLTRKTDPLQA